VLAVDERGVSEALRLHPHVVAEASQLVTILWASL